jgi:hypothetical protein
LKLARLERKQSLVGCTLAHAARELGIDKVEIRRRNFIPADAFPYQTPIALQSDSGDYQTTLDQALLGADVAIIGYHPVGTATKLEIRPPRGNYFGRRAAAEAL